MTAAIQKAYKGMGMEGSIARWYDKTTRKDMAEFRKLAERLKAGLPNGSRVLEVAPGPGFLSIELAKGNRFSVTGIDISKTFIELARKNAAEVGVGVKFQRGNASDLPFPENSFDLLVCRAAFKNFSEPAKALCEMYRVLSPGGTALIIDLRRDTPMSAITEYIDNLGVNAVNRWFMQMSFRFMLLKRAYTKQQFELMLADIPFTKTEIREAPEDMGMEIWMRK